MNNLKNKVQSQLLSYAVTLHIDHFRCNLHNFINLKIIFNGFTFYIQIKECSIYIISYSKMPKHNVLLLTSFHETVGKNLQYKTIILIDWHKFPGVIIQYFIFIVSNKLTRFWQWSNNVNCSIKLSLRIRHGFAICFGHITIMIDENVFSLMISPRDIQSLECISGET